MSETKDTIFAPNGYTDSRIPTLAFSVGTSDRRVTRKTARYQRQRQYLYDAAQSIRKEHPHLRECSIPFLMAVIHKHGQDKIARLAAKNLSEFLFRKAVNR